MEVSDIKQLLLNELPDHFSLIHRATAGDLNLQEHQNEEFSLCDEKACTACKNKGMQSCTTQEVAKYHAGTSNVLTIDIETVLAKYNGYDGLRNNRCDLLHVDTDLSKFVLNELTCTKPKYVEPFDNTSGHQDGKRNKAQKQMEEVAKLLIEVPAIQSYIKTFNERIALFSWRDPSQDEKPANIAEQSMEQFGLPLQYISNITTLKVLNNGFKLVQQLYPSIYNL